MLHANIYSQQNYTEQILQMRKEKDLFFSDSVKSPLKPNERKEFTGLKYFAVDSNYRVTATLIAYKKKKNKKFNTSSGNVREYSIYGEIVFTLFDKKISLQVYQTLNPGKSNNNLFHLFLPFTDNTSGEESYGGGRYIDCEINNPKYVVIDFNLAYNPYCAYTNGYSCPIPPKENHIPIEIRAGEKKYKDH